MPVFYMKCKFPETEIFKQSLQISLIIVEYVNVNYKNWVYLRYVWQPWSHVLQCLRVSTLGRSRTNWGRWDYRHRNNIFSSHGSGSERKYLRCGDCFLFWSMVSVEPGNCIPPSAHLIPMLSLRRNRNLAAWRLRVEVAATWTRNWFPIGSTRPITWLLR